MKRAMDNFCGILLVSCLLLFGAVVIFPVLVTIVSSFDARRFVGTFPPENFSLRWYKEFFLSSYYMRGLYYSLVIATSTALLSSAIGFLAAVGLSYSSRKVAGAAASLFVAPLIVPGVVLGFGMLFFFSRLGISWAFWRILAAHVIITLPYTIRTALAGIHGVRRSMVESALSLGATDLRVIQKILLPIAGSSVATGALFAFVFSMDDVAVTIFLTGTDIYTLPIAMVSNMKSDFNLSIAAASTFIVFMTLVMLFVLEMVVGIDRMVGRGIYRQGAAR